MKLKRILGGLGVIALAALGTQLVAVQASSAHTPSASVTCTTWSIGASNYEAAQHNTYSYSIDGGAATTGSFTNGFSKSGTFAAGTGDHTLVGYVYQNGNSAATYSKTYNLKTTGCALDKDVTLCHATDSNTNPYVEITVDAAGAYNGHLGHTGPVWNPTLKADHIKWGDIIPTFSYSGHQYSLNVPAGQALLDNGCSAAPTAVSAAAVTFTDGSCSVDPSYNVPNQPAGVLTTVTGAATPLWSKTVTVTFTADEGYTLTGQAVYSHTFGAKPDCRSSVTPENPAVNQATCDYAGQLGGFLITPVTTDGISYTVKDLVVTATATDGHKLGNLPDGWTMAEDSDTVATFTVVQADPTCLVDVSPVNPTVTDAVCDSTTGIVSGMLITPATTDGVTYTVDGLVVTATADAAHKLANTAGWDMADDSNKAAIFTVVPVADPTCWIDTTSTEPAFSEDVCKADTSTGSSVTVASSTGVNYLIDGVVTAAGPHAAVDGSTVTVTAEAQENYNLSGIGSWTHTFSAAPTCHEVGGVHVTRPPAAHVAAHDPVAASSTPLASTGVPTISLLVIGGLLALFGGGLCFLATTRRGMRA
jgi:hypothetical protein